MNDHRLFANIDVTRKEYASMLFFLSLCGNVFFSFYLPNTMYVITALLFILLYINKAEVKKRINENAKNNMKQTHFHIMTRKIASKHILSVSRQYLQIIEGRS